MSDLRAGKLGVVAGAAGAAPTLKLKRLGRYEVREHVATGSSATVYRGFDTLAHRDVALKVPHPERVATTRDRARFVVEAAISGPLSHPSIVALHDVSAHGRQPFLVMEWMPGRSLAEMVRRCRSEGGLSALTILRWVRQLAEGLAYAHERSVIHGDVKAENALLAFDHPDAPVKLADFGLATRNPATAWRQREKDGAHDGADRGLEATLRYLAPERVRLRSGPSTAADLYALGVLLFHLITAQWPYDGETPKAILEAIARGQRQTLKWPSEMNVPGGKRPDAMLALVEALLASNPQERPASAKVVVQWLLDIEHEWTDVGSAERDVMGVARRSAVAVALVTALLGGAASEWVLARDRALLEDNATAALSAWMALVGRFLAEDVVLEDAAALSGTLTDLVGRDDAVALAIFDAGGVILAEVGEANSAPAASRVIEHPNVVIEHDREASMWQFSREITYSQRTVGRLEAWFDRTALDAQMAARRLVQFWLLGALTLAVAVGAFWIVVRFRRVVHRLDSALADFAAGDLARRIPIRGNEAFGTLYRRFNRMAEALSLRLQTLTNLVAPVRSESASSGFADSRSVASVPVDAAPVDAVSGDAAPADIARGESPTSDSDSAVSETGRAAPFKPESARDVDSSSWAVSKPKSAANDEAPDADRSGSAFGGSSGGSSTDGILSRAADDPVLDDEIEREKYRRLPDRSAVILAEKKRASKDSRR
ncbi:MAG: protein kinase domain-containing protein [Thioalkalivibrionaceae bacterium]